jgi:hypothetical protein
MPSRTQTQRINSTAFTNSSKNVRSSFVRGAVSPSRNAQVKISTQQRKSTPSRTQAQQADSTAFASPSKRFTEAISPSRNVPAKISAEKSESTSDSIDKQVRIYYLYDYTDFRSMKN